LGSEAQTRAREALLQQMNQAPVETPMPVPAPAPTVVSTPAPAPVAVAPAEPVTPAVKPAPVVAVVTMSPANVSDANYPGKELGFAPILAPPLPISAAKEQQLDALLAQYQADQISPEQYHTQRAAILAQPDSTSH
jgi:hypothetical protein